MQFTGMAVSSTICKYSSGTKPSNISHSGSTDQPQGRRMLTSNSGSGSGSSGNSGSNGKPGTNATNSVNITPLDPSKYNLSPDTSITTIITNIKK